LNICISLYGEDHIISIQARFDLSHVYYSNKDYKNFSKQYEIGLKNMLINTGCYSFDW